MLMLLKLISLSSCLCTFHSPIVHLSRLGSRILILLVPFLLVVRLHRRIGMYLGIPNLILRPGLHEPLTWHPKPSQSCQRKVPGFPLWTTHSQSDIFRLCHKPIGIKSYANISFVPDNLPCVFLDFTPLYSQDPEYRRMVCPGFLKSLPLWTGIQTSVTFLLWQMDGCRDLT